MNTIVAVLTVVAFFILIAAYPAQSEEGQIPALRYTYKSRCGPGEPALAMQRWRLIPWMQQLERRLKGQPNYDALLAEYATKSESFAMIHFEVETDGTIVNSKIKCSSHWPDLDKKFLSLVANAGPLEHPVNTLPKTLGIDAALGLFTVSHGKNIMYFRSDIGPIDILSDEKLREVEQTSRNEEEKITKGRIMRP